MARDLWDIEKEFERMKRQMNHLINVFFSDSFDKKELMDVSFKAPVTDIYETEKEIVVKIEVPGVKKEDIKLEVKDGVFSLKAEHKLEKEKKREKKYHIIERSYSGFSRSFSLPVEVDETKVKAEYKSGILEVHIPKKDGKNKEGGKYIDIN